MKFVVFRFQVKNLFSSPPKFVGFPGPIGSIRPPMPPLEPGPPEPDDVARLSLISCSSLFVLSVICVSAFIKVASVRLGPVAPPPAAYALIAPPTPLFPSQPQPLPPSRCCCRCGCCPPPGEVMLVVEWGPSFFWNQISCACFVVVSSSGDFRLL